MSSLILSTDTDTRIEGINNPDGNHGTSALATALTFILGAKAFWNRTLLKFDISGIPAGSTINTVTIGLHANSIVSAEDIYVKRCTRDWPELEATWNDWANGQAWTNPGGDFDAALTPAEATTPGSIGPWEIPTSAELIAIGQDALDNRAGVVNIGIHLQDEADDGTSRGASFQSSEDPNKPTITIDYTQPEPAPVPVAALTPDAHRSTLPARQGRRPRAPRPMQRGRQPARPRRPDRP